jgi:ribokinase
MSPSRICVIGSSNMDMNSYVPRFPKPGETLHGTQFSTGYGGKGANQAVMTARLGARVSFVAKVGDDVFGRDMLDNFGAEGFDSRFVSQTTRASTGVAVITIDEDGENTIVVIPGANGLLSPDDVDAARPAIEEASVLVCQMEIPQEANLAALHMARAAGVTTIFNPAPAVAGLPDEIYQLSDIFCPNETEAEILTGKGIGSTDEAEDAARHFLSKGAGQVIITLGEQGSLLVTQSGSEMVPTERVNAVDTTGAGDAFVGSLAYFISTGLPLTDAMARANRIAAISVQKPGTQASYPRRADLPSDLITD